MRVLHLLSQLELTGAESYAITIAEKQIDMGYDVYIMSDTINTETRAKYVRFELNRRGFYNRYNHIRFITDFICQHKIEIVHSHSRASSWSGHMSAKFTGIPHIASVHQILPGGFTKKLLPCLGEICLANCENVKEAIIKNYAFPQDKIIVLRNPFNTDIFSNLPISDGKMKIVIVGRYSGPKGRVIIWFLKEVISEIEKEIEPFEIFIIGKRVDEIGRIIDEISKGFRKCEVNQIGFVSDIRDVYKISSIIVGAGRVAIEGILTGRCVLALGEQGFLGLVTSDRIDNMEASSYGDCLFQSNFNTEFAKKEILYTMKHFNNIVHNQDSLIQKVIDNHDSEVIVSNINEWYRFLISSKGKDYK